MTQVLQGEGDLLPHVPTFQNAYKSYRVSFWALSKKDKDTEVPLPYWFFFHFIYKYMESILEQSRKVMGWKPHVSSLYYEFEEDNMKILTQFFRYYV